MQGYAPSGLLIGSQTANQVPSSFLNKRVAARAGGPMEEYQFSEIRPKKQLKEIRKVLLPEKKRFLLIKFGYKFNLTNRCVICGTHHEWDISDPYRPGIPLHEVTKGRPLRGTYCQKHAGMYKQMEMLEQQILADEHGLEFKRWIPKPRVPQIINKGPLTSLGPNDVTTLIAAGWVIKPPTVDEEPPNEEYKRLMIEIQGSLDRVNKLVIGDEE
mgnify:FL=1